LPAIYTSCPIPTLLEFSCFIDLTAPHSSLTVGPDGQVVRLVLVPCFSKTGTLVLVNLHTLQCQPITFEGRFKPI
jgi:hypothetical protein